MSVLILNHNVSIEVARSSSGENILKWLSDSYTEAMRKNRAVNDWMNVSKLEPIVSVYWCVNR